MAQLESGKTYIVPNIGIRDYVKENGNSHTSEEYFIWLANKIKTGLNLDLNYNIISDGNVRHCFLELPYINDPTENRLHLYLKASGNDYAVNLIPKISYSNGENYFISIYECLPHIIHYNQQGAVHFSNQDDRIWSREYSSRNTLSSAEYGTFVLDTTYLDNSGFYNIYFMRNIEPRTIKIDKAIFTPRIFICDMIDVLTKEHFDCAFSLPNIPSESYAYEKYAGYVMYGDPYGLGQPSIAAIGVNKKREYTLQGFVPQIFTVDLDGDDLHYDDNIHSNSMIRLQFGRMKTYKDIYILLGNSMSEMKKYCKKENIVENHFSWYKDALKINNDKYSLSCSCDISGYTQDFFKTPQWAVAIKDNEKPKIKLVSWSAGTDEEITAMINSYYDGTLTLADIQSVWSVGDIRSINISAMSATGVYDGVRESHKAQTIELQIIDFNRDILTAAIKDKTKSLITVHQKNCLSSNLDGYGKNDTELGYMNSTLDATWETCHRRIWCNEVYYNALPAYLKPLIKQVVKTTRNSSSDSKIVTNDKCFLLSFEEYHDKVYDYYNYYDYPERYYYSIKKPFYDSESKSARMWLRDYNSNGFFWIYVDPVNAGIVPPYAPFSIAPAMCL